MRATMLMICSLSFTSVTLSQSPNNDSLIQLNGIEGKFEILTDDIFPNKDGHLGKGLFPLPKYYQWKRKLSASIGLDYVFVFSPIYQFSLQSKNVTSNIENDLLGKWRLIENKRSKGNVSFWFMHIYNFTERNTSEFSVQEGLSLESNLGDIPYQNYIAIMGLWWEQSFIHDKLLFRVGHINSNMVWGNNTYINDDRNGFMNSLSSSQEGTSWVGNRSLGFQASYIESNYYIAAGFQDASSDQRYPDFENFFTGHITTHIEFGLTPELNFGSGKYSLTLSSVQNLGEEFNYSFLLNIRQDVVPDKVGLFARYGTQSNAVSSSLESALTAGIYLSKVFSYASDAVGLAYINAKSAEQQYGTDQGLEGFYRILLTDRLDFTLDLMYYFELSRINAFQSAFISSVRMRFVL